LTVLRHHRSSATRECYSSTCSSLHFQYGENWKTTMVIASTKASRLLSLNKWDISGLA